uniref:WD_REPEATS_REGION domain-containing protein n=1 Tax=Panagrellus redivivus TaxID=6233 RepID=A0A7E4UQK9_PANRE
MSEPSFVKIDDTAIGVVEFAVDLADLQQEKFYTKTENGNFILWTFGKTGHWEGQKIDIDVRNSAFVINKDFFVGKSYENVTSKTMEHFLLRYHGKDNIAERIVTFDDSITALAINVDGSLLVAGTENNKVYILRKKEAKYEICDQLNVNGVPLSLSIDPNDEFVAVATTERAVRVYTLNNVSDTSVMGAYFVSSFTSVTYINSSKQRRFCPVWSPNGIYMFVPTYVVHPNLIK